MKFNLRQVRAIAIKYKRVRRLGSTAPSTMNVPRIAKGSAGDYHEGGGFTLPPPKAKRGRRSLIFDPGKSVIEPSFKVYRVKDRKLLTNPRKVNILVRRLKDIYG